MPNQRVKNKIALITGAAQGIGKAIAECFAKEGAVIILGDIHHPAGEHCAKSLGQNAHYHPLDVSQEHDWQTIMAYIKAHFGQLNILVNNAGITGFDHDLGPLNPEESTLASWRTIHEVNLDSVFLGCKYAIPLMKNNGGSIINMSSRSGIVGVPGAAAYASSKAAIRNHTKTVALYCAEKGYPIRCNTLLPAAISTPIWDKMLGATDMPSRLKAFEKLSEGIPLKRVGSPEEVAYAALYFASDESSYTTGTELILDGGILAGSAAMLKPPSNS